MSTQHAERSDGHTCGCAGGGCGRVERTERGGWWAYLAPVLICLICPACLSTYAKVFAALGVGISLTNEQHGWLLAVAVGLSVVVSGWRSWRSRRAWPIVVAALGGGLLLAGHFAPHAPVEWLGIVVLLVGGLVEQQVFRHRARRADVQALPAVPDA